LQDFRDSLESRSIAPMSLKTRISAIVSFYKSNYIQVPYLNTFQGKKFIRNNDWIIKYGNGRMTLMHDKEFNTTYEKVEDQEDY
jgi:hypothetical protein